MSFDQAGIGVGMLEMKRASHVIALIGAVALLSMRSSPQAQDACARARRRGMSNTAAAPPDQAAAERCPRTLKGGARSSSHAES